MLKIILMIVGLILVAFGVICIFDARVITKRMFSFGDQNEGSMGLKIIGFIISIIGAIMIYFQVIMLPHLLRFLR